MEEMEEMEIAEKMEIAEICRDLQSVFQTSLQASRALMKFKAVWVLGWCFLKGKGPMDIDISIYSS